MGKALSGLTKVAFIERWPSYRVATIDRFHCTVLLEDRTHHTRKRPTPVLCCLAILPSALAVTSSLVTIKHSDLKPGLSTEKPTKAKLTRPIRPTLVSYNPSTESTSHSL